MNERPSDEFLIASKTEGDVSCDIYIMTDVSMLSFKLVMKAYLSMPEYTEIIVKETPIRYIELSMKEGLSPEQATTRAIRSLLHVIVGAIERAVLDKYSFDTSKLNALAEKWISEKTNLPPTYSVSVSTLET